MSFLSQLRQSRQLTDSTESLQLCYLITIDASNANLALQLSLSELHQGQLYKTGKAYQPQRDHLLSPPPFIQPQDLPILSQLLAADPLWSSTNRGRFPDSPEPDKPGFWRELLLSQRCFLSTQKPSNTIRWQQARIGDIENITPAWAINAQGGQSLYWQHDSTAVLCFLGQPLLFYPTSGKVSPTRCPLDSAAIERLNQQTTVLTADKAAAFADQHQLTWSKQGLPLPQKLPQQIHDSQLTPLLYLHSRRDLQAVDGWRSELQLRFRYCSKNYCTTLIANEKLSSSDYWDGAHLIHLHQHDEQEAEVLKKLLSHVGGFDAGTENQSWHSEDPLLWRVLLLGETRKDLTQAGFQFLIDKKFRHHYVAAEQWQVQLSEQAKQQYSLAIKLQAEGQTINLLALLKQLHTLDLSADLQHSCLKLEDGRLLLLPTDKLQGLAQELADLLTNADAGANGYTFNRYQLARLDSLKKLLPDDTRWQGDTALLDQALAIHQQPKHIACDTLALNAQLRDYQQTGICWLQHIKQHNVHGLLADDMGLGKTLQTIGHLCLEKQQGCLQQPALVIAPTSLLHNWASEIRRFAPQLSLHILHGPQRHQYWQNPHHCDLLITSYTLASRDLELWQQQTLSWVILDEAQMIKNPRTQISRAVKQLQCQYRLCLSGTPIENHLGELWSIFDFLMPGCLGNEGDFKRYFKKPIEEQADARRFQQLLQRIAPFMLRRSKDQVAADLPPKTEISQHIVMDDDQQALYQQIKTSSWWQLQQDMEEENNSGKQQIQVLSALLKLRQVCCDPQLLGENNVSSAKRQHCIEMICELVAEKRALLVFSQFTSMLDLLAEDLQKNNIPYLQLTGKTKKRQQLVDAFQAGEAPVFLISLKAGGVGLNLTRADTVIHYDPWWNNAAQQQATDRAHRIGQDKPVFVYKLIMEASIEEKIAELQQRKALLGERVTEQAQNSSEQFSLKLKDLLALIED